MSNPSVQVSWTDRGSYDLVDIDSDLRRAYGVTLPGTDELLVYPHKSDAEATHMRNPGSELVDVDVVVLPSEPGDDLTLKLGIG